MEQHADEYHAHADFLDDYDRDCDRLLRKRMAALYDQVTKLGGLLRTEAVIDGAAETSTT